MTKRFHRIIVDFIGVKNDFFSKNSFRLSKCTFYKLGYIFTSGRRSPDAAVYKRVRRH